MLHPEAMGEPGLLILQAWYLRFHAFALIRVYIQTSALNMVLNSMKKVFVHFSRFVFR
jgi:hypothetical protein